MMCFTIHIQYIHCQYIYTVCLHVLIVKMVNWTKDARTIEEAILILFRQSIYTDSVVSRTGESLIRLCMDRNRATMSYDAYYQNYCSVSVCILFDGLFLSLTLNRLGDHRPSIPSLNLSLTTTSFSYDNAHQSLGIKIIHTLNTATHVGT